MKRLVAVIFLAYCSLQSVNACCYPMQFKGQRDIIAKVGTFQREQNKFFDVDYTRGYLFETDDPAGLEFRIIDLEVNKMYDFDGDSCTERSLRFPESFARCLDPTDRDRTGIRMGAPGNSILVDTYKFKVGPMNVYKTVTASGENCVPVKIQTQGRTFSTTTSYYNTETTVDHDVFNHLTKCGVAVRPSEHPHPQGHEGHEEEEEEEDDDEEEDEDEKEE